MEKDCRNDIESVRGGNTGMIIGIDGNEANTDTRVGVHQYAFEILWSLYNINGQTKNSDTFIIFLKERPKSILPKQNKYWKYKILGAKKFWILTKLMPYLFLNKKVDVLFSPSHYLPPISRIPMVCTIHDLGYLEFSDQFKKNDYWQLKYWTARSMHIANRVVAVSKATKKDIILHYGLKSDKIDVIYHGYDKARFTRKNSSKNPDRVKKYGISKNYILYMGTLKPSKNVEGLIKAYSNLDPKLKQKYQLVIAGKKGWMFDDIFRLTKELKEEKNVVFTGFIAEEDKVEVLAGATLLASPSFWEGFGMPVLEAMAVGTPVVVSKSASLPEVAGNAGIYVDAKRIQDITKGIEKVLSMNKVQYNRLVEEGTNQASKFSWVKSGEETLKVIKKATK